MTIRGGTETVAALVQARMGSRRLPGKMLRLLAGRPVLDYVLDRLARIDRLDHVVVATTTASPDDAIAEFCEARHVACVRGEEDDVAGRFCLALEDYPVDAFVRVCGDRPLLDVALVNHGLDLFEAEDVDVVSNVNPPTYPPGQTVEILRTETFKAACAAMRLPADREHVTPLFYREAGRFRVRNFAAGQDYSGIRTVIDSEADARVLEAVIGRMTRDHWTYSVADVAALYRMVAGA